MGIPKRINYCSTTLLTNIPTHNYMPNANTFPCMIHWYTQFSCVVVTTRHFEDSLKKKNPVCEVARRFTKCTCDLLDYRLMNSKVKLSPAS